MIPENPVAYYSLDGDSATNEVTGTDATVVGEPTSGADGIVNSACEFTTSGDTDSVSDALVSGENLPINGDGATVSAWFNYTEHEGAGRILQVSGDTESPPTNGFNVEMGDDDLFVVTWQDSTLQNIGSSISVEPNTWYNLIVVMDGSEFSVHVFDQDGEIDASPVVEELGRSNTGDEPLLLACGDSSEIAGRIDEVRAYDRALTQFEAADLWEASQNPGDGGGDDGSGGDDGGSDEANVLTNSSFESGSLDGWGSNTWSGQGDYSQGSEAYSGDASAQLSSDNGVDGSLQQTDVPVEPNTDYVLSGWINTENVQGDGHGALLNVQQLAADDVNVMAGPVTGTSDWTQVEWTFNSGENDVLTVNCSLGGWGKSTGTAWFDDLSLVPAGDGS